VETHRTRVELSVVVSTYNRADTLARAIESLIAQDVDPSRYEIVIVDNNSSDHTRQVVESLRSKAPSLSYVFEPRQGTSYGRNRGILTASAPLIAFTDDDVRVPPDWASVILTVFAQHPEVSCIGGKVLPSWSGPWPSWLTRQHWSPLALLDYGDTPFYVNAAHRLCLIGANVAYRRDTFDRIGLFSTQVQTLKREPGTEDHEILLRLWRDGGQGLYWPALTATADIAPERMRRQYHRQWHRRHGRFSATMRDEQLEETRLGTFLGAPGHAYRHAAASLAGWIGSLLRLNTAAAFTHELEFRSACGFLLCRWAERLHRGHDRFLLR
jgi:glycosyltransferase involved in cell wall biosynthesis